MIRNSVALVGVFFLALMGTGCATAPHRHDRYDYPPPRRCEERPVGDLAVQAFSRVGTATVHYKLQEFSGSRPKASLNQTIENELINFGIDAVLDISVQLLRERYQRRYERVSGFDRP